MVKQKLMMWVRYEKILDAQASRKKIEKCQYSCSQSATTGIYFPTELTTLYQENNKSISLVWS